MKNRNLPRHLRRQLPRRISRVALDGGYKDTNIPGYINSNTLVYS